MAGAIYGPIPVMAIDYVADREGMGQSDKIIFRRVIRAMDNAYMKASGAKRLKEHPPK